MSSLEQWVIDANAGDNQAWNFLYGLYYPALYSIALQICGNTAVAKDAVQNTFISAYLKLGSLKDGRAFGGWIRKILIRNCYRSLRRENNNRPLDEKCFASETSCQFDQLYSQARLHSALAKLPEVLHGTLLLRYFSEFQSYQEIANILSVPVGTVRSRLSQAKEKLSANWKNQEEASEQICKQNQEWNEFYSSTFSALHKHDTYKNKFLSHLKKDIEIVFSRHQRNSGSWLIDKEINQDRKFGSWFTPVNIFRSGTISVIEG